MAKRVYKVGQRRGEEKEERSRYRLNQRVPRCNRSNESGEYRAKNRAEQSEAEQSRQGWVAWRG